MYSAPSVNYPVGRSHNAERLLLTLWAVGACCAVASCWRFGGADWRQGVLVLSVVMSGALAWIGSVRSAAVANLGFDGQHWSLREPAGAPGTVRANVALDLQSLLLIRLTAPGRSPRWVWLEQRAMPERWRDLRRALYSRAPASARVHHPFP